MDIGDARIYFEKASDFSNKDVEQETRKWPISELWSPWKQPGH